MPKVIVVNKGSHDYSAALTRGELVFMTEDLIEPHSVGRMMRSFLPYINDTEDGDFIMQTGLTVMCMVAAGAMGYRHGKLDLLVFSRGKYLHRPVDYRDIIKRVEEEEDG
jgi:hypothetical protein